MTVTVWKGEGVVQCTKLARVQTVITCIVHKWVLKLIQGFHCNKNQCVLIQYVFKKIKFK